MCSDAIDNGETSIGDPTEIALVRLSSDYGKSPEKTREMFPRLGEVPFDSDRKLMSTVNHYNGQQICITKGAEDVMIERIASVETPEGIVPVTDEFRKRIQEETLHFSEQGLRVLAFAYKPVEDCGLRRKMKTICLCGTGGYDGSSESRVGRCCCHLYQRRHPSGNDTGDHKVTLRRLPARSAF